MSTEIYRPIIDTDLRHPLRLVAEMTSKQVQEVASRGIRLYLLVMLEQLEAENKGDADRIRELIRGLEE